MKTGAIAIVRNAVDIAPLSTHALQSRHRKGEEHTLLTVHGLDCPLQDE